MAVTELLIIFWDARGDQVMDMLLMGFFEMLTK